MSSKSNRVCGACLRLAACVLASAILALPAGAAVPGAVGPTSTGSLDLTLTNGISARIAGLTDFNLGLWSGSGDMAANQDICIGRNGVGLFAAGTYRIRAFGDGDASDVSAFTLTNGVDLIYYDVLFNDQTGTGGREALTAGVMAGGQTGLGLWEIFNWLFGCTVRNANVSIVVPAAELSAAPGGTFAGTLTLVLIPD